MVTFSNNYTHLGSQTAYTTGLTVNTGACTLERIIVNTTSACTIGLIDATSGVTANVLSLKASVAEGTYYYNLRLSSALRVVTSGHPGDVTFVWRT